MTLTAELASKVTPTHLGRDAYVYVRQSTLTQVREHTESLERQYELADRATDAGLAASPGGRRRRGPGPLGRGDATAREGFKNLVADVGLGKVGIIFGIEVSRLARNNADWYQLLDLCALTDTLDRRRRRAVSPRRLQRPSGARLEGHHARGGAASDPSPPDRRVAPQGSQG